jgi:signal transduction histidine kinase
MRIANNNFPATQAAPFQPPGSAGARLRLFLAYLAYVQVFNVLVGLIVAFVMNAGKSVFEDILASICIGTLAFLFIYGARLAIWRANRRPGALPFMVLLAVGAWLAQVVGTRMFRWLLGIGGVQASPFASPKTAGLMLFTLTTAAGVSLFFYGRAKIVRLETVAAQEKARAALVEKQALQAQLQMLQAQIEPHMLFNTLANLQGLIGFDPDRAQLLLDQLIQYLRATLSASRSATTTLAKEFSLMEAYLGLMSVRMGERLAYTLELPQHLRQLPLPPMLLQPLVENAIQHGLEPKIAGGHITVRATEQDGQLLLAVSDTGLGLDHPGGRRPGTGLGLANIRERLTVLYGAHAALTLSLAPGDAAGTVAQLRLPLPAATEPLFPSFVQHPVSALNHD